MLKYQCQHIAQHLFLWLWVAGHWACLPGDTIPWDSSGCVLPAPLGEAVRAGEARPAAQWSCDLLDKKASGVSWPQHQEEK